MSASNAVVLPSCGYCGAFHNGTCPRIKRISYHPNGNVAEVEFLHHTQWPTSTTDDLGSSPASDSRSGHAAEGET